MKKKPLPKDPNKRSYEIVKMSTEEPEEPKKGRSLISEYLAEIGRKGGLIGGKARANKLSTEQRKDIATKAAQIRWSKRNKGGGNE